MSQEVLNKVQFYHGTAHEFSPGDVIDPSQPHRVVNMGNRNRVYMAPTQSMAAEYAKSAAEEMNWNGVRGPDASYEGPHRPHVYQVEPLGDVEQDNASHRGLMTKHPVRVLGEA